MEIGIVVAAPDSARHELTLHADVGHRVEDLCTGVQKVMGCEGDDLWLYGSRPGLNLAPGTRLADTGLRHGDELVLRRRALGFRTPRRRGGVELVVVSGPAAGDVVELDEGDNIIGRRRDLRTRVADDFLSKEHLAVRVSPEGVFVRDLGSTNGTALEDSRLREEVPWPEEQLVVAGASLLGYRRTRDDPVPPPAGHDGRVSFNRPPRMRAPQQGPAVVLPKAPDARGTTRLPVQALVAPLLMGGAYLALAPAGGRSGLVMAAMTAMSALMAIVSYGGDRLGLRRTHTRARKDYLTAIDDAQATLQDRLETARAQARTSAPGPDELVRRARAVDAALWERRPADPDFLSLRVGFADVPSALSAEVPTGGDEPLRAEATKLTAEFAEIPAAPALAPLAEIGVLGLSGSRAAVSSATRWLVVQAVTQQSPRDLLVAGALSPEEDWSWLSWLPHAASFASGAADAASARRLLQELLALVDERREAKVQQPALLALLDARVPMPRSTISRLLAEAPSVGIRVVWLGDQVRDLPGECGAYLDVDAARLVTPHTGSTVEIGGVDGISLGHAWSAALALAPVNDTSAQAATGELPTYLSLVDLVGGDLSSGRVQELWSSESAGLGAPVGMGEAGILELDLRLDGPHALLGGTTGAGKSEMLQTLVGSLAMHHPPTRLTFLLVDYKGGAAFKDCVRLPHVVGFVTDLSGHLVQRALTSLHAELHRRERLLASVGAKDLVDMERSHPGEAPPSLLLVVDEFATLAKELPEFVDGVVNVAQRGRSLGIHLLLATQRPAGAINDNLRANTNLRMALRMNDEADSHDVLGVPDAARLPRTLPGRAFVRTGSSEITQVQFAYVGGRTAPQAEQGSELTVRPWREPQQRAPKAESPGPTDLQLIVDAVVEAADRLALPEQRSPWLPALPATVVLEPAGRPFAATVGLVDRPGEQRQDVHSFDLDADGSLLVLGTSGAGKTTCLRTLAVSLARRHTPDEVHLYALDFGSRGLTSLESLPHCGAVIAGDDIERVQRLFAMIERWVAERRRRFAETGATSLTEYSAVAPDRPMPRVVILLDAYAGFASAFEKIDYGARVDQLPHLVNECRPLGISFVITATRRNALSSQLAATMASSVVLRMADVDDYAIAGVDPRVAKTADLVAGRGFVGSLEIQCAVVSADPSGSAQQAAVTAAGREIRAAYGDGSAPPVGVLPDKVALVAMRGLSRGLRPCIGVGETDLSPVAVDLTDSHFLVAGPQRSGKSTTLAALALGLRQANPELELVLLAPRRTPLASLDCWSAVARGEDAIAQVCEGFQERLLDEDGNKLLIVLDDGHELLDGPADGLLEVLARKGRDGSVRLVGACDTVAASRSYGGWVAEVRRDRQGVLLMPDPDSDGDLLGVRLPRGTRPAAGRGYLVVSGAVEGLRIASG